MEILLQKLDGQIPGIRGAITQAIFQVVPIAFLITHHHRFVVVASEKILQGQHVEKYGANTKNV